MDFHFLHQRYAALHHVIHAALSVVLDATILVDQLLMLIEKRVPVMFPDLWRVLKVDVVVLTTVDVVDKPLVCEVDGGEGYLAARGEDGVAALLVIATEHGSEIRNTGG